MRLIVGMTGASGVVLAVELLKRLKQIDSVETHLVTKRTSTYSTSADLPIAFTT